MLASQSHGHEEGRISVHDLGRVRKKGQEGAFPQAKASHLQRLLEKHFRTSPDSGMGGSNAIKEGLGGAECHRWEGLGEHMEARGLLPTASVSQ